MQCENVRFVFHPMYEINPLQVNIICFVFPFTIKLQSGWGLPSRRMEVYQNDSPPPPVEPKLLDPPPCRRTLAGWALSVHGSPPKLPPGWAQHFHRKSIIWHTVAMSPLHFSRIPPPLSAHGSLPKLFVPPGAPAWRVEAELPPLSLRLGPTLSS